LNAANQVITQKLKPGIADVQRIHRVEG